MGSIGFFVPVKGDSERFSKKNYRRFGDFEFGLLEIKLRQLNQLNDEFEIVISSESTIVLEIASQLLPNAKLVERNVSLASAGTTISEMCRHAFESCSATHIAWTHVTSPFFTASDYSLALSTFAGLLETETADSVFTVNRHKEFLLLDGLPMNFKVRGTDSWPRTQDLLPFETVNSALFICNRTVLATGNRLGHRPFAHVSEKFAGFDIDTESDFYLAQLLLQNQLAHVGF